MLKNTNKQDRSENIESTQRNGKGKLENNNNINLW